MQQQYQCPNCGAQVAFGVNFCGNCRTQLNWPAQQQMQSTSTYQQQQPEQKRRRSPWLIVCFAAIGIVVLIGLIGGSVFLMTRHQEPDHRQRVIEETPIVITSVQDLNDECQNNPIAFANKYKGKVVQIQGEIQHIGVSGWTNEPYLLVGEGDREKTMSASFFVDDDDMIAKLHTGQIVVIKGIMTGGADMSGMYLEIEHCVLLSPR
jgi:hypothetical protein